MYIIKTMLRRPWEKINASTQAEIAQNKIVTIMLFSLSIINTQISGVGRWKILGAKPGEHDWLDNEYY